MKSSNALPGVLSSESNLKKHNILTPIMRPDNDTKHDINLRLQALKDASDAVKFSTNIATSADISFDRHPFPLAPIRREVHIF